MKKIINISNNKIKGFLLKSIFCLLILNSGKGFAQSTSFTPLQPGFAVSTFSGSMWPNSAGGTSNWVLEVVRTNNTSGAPIGTTWTSSPSGSLPWSVANWNSFSYVHPNWYRNKLGNIFGVTLDNAPNPNIYVSATSVYGSQVSGIPTGRIWRLDGTTGAENVFVDIPVNTGIAALGNLKFFGGNIYVSNMHDGKIYRYTVAGSVAGASTTFDPRYGDAGATGINNGGISGGFAANDQNTWGLAIRSTPAETRLYYAKVGAVKEIWSVQLDPSAGFNFIPATERKELSTGTLASTASSAYVADIAFTLDGNRMLVGERTMSSPFSGTSAHQSACKEFLFNAGNPVGSQWAPSTNTFGTGKLGAGTNCAGGVSYSNSLFRKNNRFDCDSSVFCTSDALFYSGMVPSQDALHPGYSTYGVAIFNALGSNTWSNSIALDLDNETSSADKTYQGDVEVYRLPLNCSPCGCGQWTSLTLNGSSLNLLAPAINFAQGNVNGTIAATYLCTGQCLATLNWELWKGGSQINSGAGLPINLSTFNNLACGDYIIKINAVCNGVKCNPLQINFTVSCTPPPCCPPNIIIDVKPTQQAIIANSNPNGYSLLTQGFAITTNVPMSEVRVNVEEFVMTGDPSESCIACKNRPNTWGSLLNGTMNGSPMTVPSPLLPTSIVYEDNRELDYKPGSLFTLTNSASNFQIALPPVSDLACCKINIYICLKFTFKDKDCRECVVMYCMPVSLIKDNLPGIVPPQQIRKTGTIKSNI